MPPRTRYISDHTRPSAYPWFTFCCPHFKFFSKSITSSFCTKLCTSCFPWSRRGWPKRSWPWLHHETGAPGESTTQNPWQPAPLCTSENDTPGASINCLLFFQIRKQQQSMCSGLFLLHFIHLLHSGRDRPILGNRRKAMCRA